MQTLRPTLEQLQLAAAQLHEDGPAFARFSLLLSDNVIELLAHNRIMAKVFRGWRERERREMGHVEAQRYTENEVRRATGQDFSAKLNFLAKHNEIDEDLRDFSNAAHKLRNKLYHEGVRDEPILWHVAWHLHEVACAIFLKLQRGWQGELGGPKSELVRSLLGRDERPPLSAEKSIARASSMLKAAKPKPALSLGQVLRDEICRRVDHIAEVLDYMSDDGPWKTDDLDSLLKQLLCRNAKHWREFLEEAEAVIKEKTGVETVDPEQAMSGAWILREQFYRDFHTSIRMTTLQRWRTRAEALSSESAVRALLKYECLERDMTKTERAVDYGGWEHHEWEERAFEEWRDAQLEG